MSKYFKLIEVVLAHPVWAGISGVIAIIGLFSLNAPTQFAPEPDRTVTKAAELRKIAKKCLSDAHSFSLDEKDKLASQAYICARDNLTKAANLADSRAFFGLANLYSEPDIEKHLREDRERIEEAAIHYWCQARAAGVESAQVTPPFLKSFSLINSLPC